MPDSCTAFPEGGLHQVIDYYALAITRADVP